MIDGGLTDAQKETFPALASYIALRVADGTDAATLVKGQLAVAQRDGDTLTGFTGVQIPGVLDDLYADALDGVELGVSFRATSRPSACGRPTAQSATLLTWDAGATGDPQRHEATWDAASGTWSVAGTKALKGDEYLWEVVVYAPTTGRDRDEPRHRPVLGRAHARTPSARSRSTSPTRRTSRRRGRRRRRR